MDADFSIELGHEDPVLDYPWRDPTGKFAYFDLKRHPELISEIEEAARFPELAEFLRAVNSPRSSFESAKCDVWATRELDAEEKIFEARCKFASYVDLVFSNPIFPNPNFWKINRGDFSAHELLARKLTELLRRAPEIAAAVELCVRRCFFGKTENSEEISRGFYFTVYVNGYGDEEIAARKNWAIAMQLVENAILQLSARPEQAAT